MKTYFKELPYMEDIQLYHGPNPVNLSLTMSFL